MRATHEHLCLLLGLALLTAQGCAVLHRGAVGEVEARTPGTSVIEVRVSATGVDVQGIARDVGAVMAHSGNRSTREAGGIIEFIAWATDWSPRTGNGTLNDQWADGVPDLLVKRCPDGIISDVVVAREAADYGHISGEIVRVMALCRPATGSAGGVR